MCFLKVVVCVDCVWWALVNYVLVCWVCLTCAACCWSRLMHCDDGWFAFADRCAMLLSLLNLVFVCRVRCFEFYRVVCYVAGFL